MHMRGGACAATDKPPTPAYSLADGAGKQVQVALIAARVQHGAGDGGDSDAKDELRGRAGGGEGVGAVGMPARQGGREQQRGAGVPHARRVGWKGEAQNTGRAAHQQEWLMRPVQGGCGGSRAGAACAPQRRAAGGLAPLQAAPAVPPAPGGRRGPWLQPWRRCGLKGGRGWGAAVSDGLQAPTNVAAQHQMRHRWADDLETAEPQIVRAVVPAERTFTLQTGPYHLPPPPRASIIASHLQGPHAQVRLALFAAPRRAPHPPSRLPPCTPAV